MGDLKSKDVSLDGVKKQRGVVMDNIKAKDKEIDAVTKEMDVVGAKIKGLAEKDSEKRSLLDGLFKERDGFKKEISVVLKEKDTMRDEYRENNNAWWNSQRAVKAQRQVQYEEEKAAYVKKKEEEELKKIPYEEEMTLCIYLAEYLERTHLNGGDSGSKISVKKEEVIAVTDDPFAGMTAAVKKVDDEFFSTGKGKGKKKKRQRANKKAAASAPFVLSVDSFEQFGSIGLNPPTKLEQVEASVKELREKKIWYSKQPRGSVATAKDIRKKNEKSFQKLRQTPSTKAVPSGKFSASDDAFVPLGNGSSSTASVPSWGAGPKAVSTVSGDQVVNAS